MILGAAYLLWLYQRTMLGQVTNGKNLTLAGPELPRDGGVRAADRLGHLDRHLSRSRTSTFCEQPVAQIVERVRPGLLRRRSPMPRAGAAAHRSGHAPEARNELRQFYTTTDHFTIIPALMLALFGCAILLFDFLVFPDPAAAEVAAALRGRSAEGFTGFGLCRQQIVPAANGLTEFTAFQRLGHGRRLRIFFNWIFLIAALIVAIVSYKYLEIAGEHHGEYYGLILFAQCGMYFLATGTDLITLFIGLELMALCFYVMVGFLREREALERGRDEVSAPGRLLDAASWCTASRCMYGMAGSTKLADIAAAIAQRAALGSGGLPGDGHHRGRPAVQDLGRAVPHVGARRLRRRADHRHGVSLGRFEGRVASRSCCASSWGRWRRVAARPGSRCSS